MIKGNQRYKQGTYEEKYEIYGRRSHNIIDMVGKIIDRRVTVVHDKQEKQKSTKQF